MVVDDQEATATANTVVGGHGDNPFAATRKLSRTPAKLSLNASAEIDNVRLIWVCIFVLCCVGQ
jgi:hypothetical protein